MNFNSFPLMLKDLDKVNELKVLKNKNFSISNTHNSNLVFTANKVLNLKLVVSACDATHHCSYRSSWKYMIT